jgi:hypothetical protein
MDWIGRSAGIQQLAVVEDAAGCCFRLSLTEVYQHFGGDPFLPPATPRCEGELASLVVARFEADIHLIFNLPDGQHGEVLV